MKLLFDFEIMELDDEIIAVPVGENSNAFHGVLKINETAKSILSLLKDDTTEDSIVSELLKEYSCPEGNIAFHVHNYIEQLRQVNLLSE